MPADRTLAEQLAADLTNLYADVETRLATDVARRLEAGLDQPDWAERKLASVGRLRRWSENLTSRLDNRLAGQVEQTLTLAYMRGGDSALRELAALQSTHAEWLDLAGVNQVSDRLRDAIARRAGLLSAELADIRTALPGIDAVQRLQFSLTSGLRGTHTRITRWAVDSYREVVGRASADTLLGLATRRRTAQVAWEQLLERGVTGFVDRSGRRWNLATYVEMSTRTHVAHAAVEGHLDRLGAAGLDLVIVSDAPQECARCRPWEGQILTRTGGGAGTITREHATRDGETVQVDIAGSVADAVGAGLLHPNCFPAEVLVSAPSGVEAADARWYEGPLVVIHTAGGDELPVTPNHPVLTPEGWVSAGQLTVGDHVLRYRGDVESPTLGAPDDEQVPTRIGDVFNALRQASTVPPARVPVAAEQFHGDGLGSDVDVVLTDGLLRNAARYQSRHGQLVSSGTDLAALLTQRPALQVIKRPDHAADGVVSGGDLGGSLLCAHPVPLAALSFAAVGPVATSEQGGTHSGLPTTYLSGDLALRHAAEVELDGSVYPVAGASGGHASRAQLPIEGASVDSHGGCDLVGALSGLVAPDRVVQVEQRREWTGHVYNLQTGAGWYTAAGIIVHNCRHSLSAYLPGVTSRPTNTADPQGDADRQKLRKLERQVRKDKLQQAGALTDQAKRAAAGRIRAGQKAIRGHVARSSVFRQPHREQINLGNSPPGLRPTRPTSPPSPPPLPPVPAPAREFHRNLAGIVDLAAAVNRGPVRDRIALTGGVSADTQLLTLADGTRAVWKSGGNPDAEQATSMIGRALGLRAPRVYRDHPSAVYMDYVDDAQTAWQLRNADPAEWERRRRAAADHDDGTLIGLLDVLTANVDRHGGNWMLTADGRTIPIDHGHTFQTPRVGRVRRLVIEGDFAEDFRGDNPLTAADVVEARTRLEALRPDFEHMGRGAWLDYALGALDLVAARTAGTRNLLATMEPQ